VISSSFTIHLNQTRRHWSDETFGSTAVFSDMSVLRFPPAGFVFTEIDQREQVVKLSEIAYLRSVKAQARGVVEPRIVTFARLEQDCAVSEAFSGLDACTETGERLYSANSLITYTLRMLLARGWLRYDGNEWQSAVPDGELVWRDHARAVLDLLVHDGRLYLGGTLGRRVSIPMAFEGFDVRRDLMPVDRLGFPRQFVWQERPRITFNAAFFLLEHDDFISHHSALGEAYNLYVRDGAILRPPLYRRAAFYQPAGGRWRAGYFSLADMTVTLPNGTALVPEGSRLPGLSFAFNPDGGADVALYTRAFGLASHGHPLRYTPIEPGRVEFTIVDTRVVGCKIGGGLDIPQNGLILSAAPGMLPADAIPDDGLPRVRYGLAQEIHRGIRQAIQVGPMLLQGGRVVVSTSSLAAEEFWPTPPGCTNLADVGVVPTDYPEDIDRTRAGRIGLGVDDEGWLVVVAVPGTERGTHRPKADSSGATLLELAELLARAGAVDAINLDGGGSTQLFYLGGLTTVPGNRYRMPGVQFERMVPTIGVLR
jgi:hypothetical protein